MDFWKTQKVDARLLEESLFSSDLHPDPEVALFRTLLQALDLTAQPRQL